MKTMKVVICLFFILPILSNAQTEEKIKTHIINPKGSWYFD